MSSTAMADWRGFLESRIAAGTGVAVCTHGADGASGLTAAEGWIDVPAVPVPDIVDTDGAGDAFFAFFAGFAAAWLANSGLAAALRRGAELAAAVVQSPQLAPIER
jgi:sugar/nucleoside kinase (ribokinase family)